MAASSEQPAGEAAPASLAAAVLVPSNEMPTGAQKVQEIDFNKFTNKMTVEELVSGMANMGFQGSAIHQATEIINDMV
jgi:deoxyhypusine synthase